MPRGYLGGETTNKRSEFLVEIVGRHVTHEAQILEIGCNVGRNLNYLFRAGFRNLEGIEISEKAVRLLEESFPEMARNTKIHLVPVEEVIRGLKDREFNVVFTMAVLEHIHKDSEWIFPEIARITREFLITIEDEQGISWRHFPRNYRKVFEPLGMKQIEEINCTEQEGLFSSFVARVFVRGGDIGI